MKTKPGMRKKNISSECGRRDTVETGRLLDGGLSEHEHNLTQGFIGKSKLT
jgi:hypothetical protein